MTYLKIIQYFYLAFAVFFFYTAFTQFQAGEDYILSIAIAVVSLGMFFFRRHFYNKQKQNKE